MTDVLDRVWEGFFTNRNKPLQFRFEGRYRALVVETNDPLRIHRIKFLCPELHDNTLRAEDAPWAVSAFDLGTKGHGRFSYPCIGDFVWIEFEKQHPYGAIYAGFSDPTRRRFYALPSVSGPTPRPVDPQGNPVANVADFNIEYTPKDQRPMSHGWQDRYGNLDIHSGVGFFPVEHTKAPPPPEVDTFTSSILTQGQDSINFQSSEASPEQNEPDSKFMARITKYGNIFMQSDVGYTWLRDEDNNEGEFTGDFDLDAKFEIDRWLYIQRLIHEDQPKDSDQRRVMILTRYGHKFEMRDVGWNVTRDKEFSDDVPASTISDTELDQRWIKFRTKGGHLIQLSDVGSDPINDEFVSRFLLDEARDSANLDQDQDFITDSSGDARFLRFVSRSGIKIAIDDRTSDRIRAQATDLANRDLGIGVLIKGRATPAARVLDEDGNDTADSYPNRSGDPKGFYWQFDERPGRNSTTWGTPLGSVIEMTDNREAIVMATGLRNLPTTWKYLRDNEFLQKSAFDPDLDVASTTHHLIIDHELETIRLKTRAGNGEAPYATIFDDFFVGTFQGLEMRDAPSDKPWLELIDIEKRGFWFSHEIGLGIWRAKDGKDMRIWLDDEDNKIVIRNNEGKIQIFCSGDAEIKSESNVNISSGADINMKADGIVNITTGGGQFTFTQNFDSSGDVRGKNILGFFPQIKQGDGGPPGSPSGQPQEAASVETEDRPSKEEPDNRYDTT